MEKQKTSYEKIADLIVACAMFIGMLGGISYFVKNTLGFQSYLSICSTIFYTTNNPTRVFATIDWKEYECNKGSEIYVVPVIKKFIK